METKENKYRTITLTDRPPVRIREDLWPRIARGADDDCDDRRHPFQANTTAEMWVNVRQHSDGRTLVYGGYEYRTAWADRPDHSRRDGELLAKDADVAAAIRRVGEALGDRDTYDLAPGVIRECIANLPAEEI